LYENSHVNRAPHFSITVLPLSIEDADPIGQACTYGLNDYQNGVQVSFPLSTNPRISCRLPLSNITGRPDDSGLVSGGPMQSVPTPPNIPPQPTSDTSTKPLEAVTLIAGSDRVHDPPSLMARPPRGPFQTEASPGYLASKSLWSATTTMALSDSSHGVGNAYQSMGGTHTLRLASLFVLILCDVIPFIPAWVSPRWPARPVSSTVRYPLHSFCLHHPFVYILAFFAEL